MQPYMEKAEAPGKRGVLLLVKLFLPVVGLIFVAMVGYALRPSSLWANSMLVALGGYALWIYRRYGAVYAYSLREGSLYIEHFSGSRSRLLVAIPLEQVECLEKAEEKAKGVRMGVWRDKACFQLTYDGGKKVLFSPSAMLVQQLQAYRKEGAST